MAEKRSTLRRTEDEEEPTESLVPQPGLLVIASGGKPCWLPLPLAAVQGDGDDVATHGLDLGRDNLGNAVGDGRISRHHVRVRYGSAGFSATDLGSLNGTAADGQPIAPHSARLVHHCLRLGDTLLLVIPDLLAFSFGAPMIREGIVIGPRLAKIYERIARLGKSSQTLYITGESGTGKENAARTFHAASPGRSGPFIAVNCATIPEGIAERLLFGARRGAFSGAVSDSDGLIQAADKGTLFLDEVAELQSTVQSKLLRVLETREVVPVGAVRAQPVNLCVVSASHRFLRDEVTAGRLREDLYYRIGRPSERVPPLRERLEEIPWLIDNELHKGGAGLSAHVSLIEACVLRPWPGNVRELLVEIRAAAQEAIAGDSRRVKAEHLAATAGQSMQAPPETQPARSVARGNPEPAAAPDAPTPAPVKAMRERPTRAMIIAALIETKCNISAAARQLGMYRTNLRRQIESLAIDVEKLRQLGK